MLIINADDWGMCKAATDTALACYNRGRITSASAMVFMEDSERGAQIALGCGIDVGLHLNLSARFTANSAPAALQKVHGRVCRSLTKSKYALLLYNPFLIEAFRSVFEAQLAERVLYLFDWVPARLLAAAFSLAGDFVASRDTLFHGVTNISLDAPQLLQSVGQEALGGSLDAPNPDEPFGEYAAGQNLELASLLYRSAACWVALVALLVLLD